MFLSLRHNMIPEAKISRSHIPWYVFEKVIAIYSSDCFWENSLGQSIEDEHTTVKATSNSEPERSSLEPILSQNNDDCKKDCTEELCSLISFESTETPDDTKLIRQPSPPPVLAEVQDSIPGVSPQVSETLLPDEVIRAESPLQLHIVRFLLYVFFGHLAVFQEWQIGNLEYVRSFWWKILIIILLGTWNQLPWQICKRSFYLIICFSLQSTTMMEHFMKLAKSNTDKDLETCGILAGTLVSLHNTVTVLSVRNSLRC